jgi:hypothetical protein
MALLEIRHIIKVNVMATNLKSERRRFQADRKRKLGNRPKIMKRDSEPEKRRRPSNSRRKKSLFSRLEDALGKDIAEIKAVVEDPRPRA